MELKIMLKNNRFLIYKIGLFLFGVLLLSCLWIMYVYMTDLNEKIIKDKSTLKDILFLEREYKTLYMDNRKKMREVKNIIILIENITKDLDIQKNIVSITPIYINGLDKNSNENIEIKMEGIGIEEFVNLLYRLKLHDVKIVKMRAHKNSVNTISLEMLITNR